jgi:tetratricopeptide (TPR) repeat protein
VRNNHPALFIAISLLGISSWFVSTGYAQIKPSDFLSSDQFSPETFEKTIGTFDLQKDERKLFYAFNYQLKGQLTSFTKTMEDLNSRSVSFESRPFFSCFYHLQRAYYYETKGQIPFAKKEALISQKIANQQHEKTWESWAYSRLGRLYAKENKKDSSIIFHKKSIEFAKRSEGKLTMALVLHEFAVSNNQFLQIEQAVEQELLALELVQKIKNDYYTAKFYQFIATLSLNAGNLRESEHYLLKSNQKNNQHSNKLLALENELLNYRLLLRKTLPGEVLLYLPKTLKSLERFQAEESIGEAWLIYGQALSSLNKSDAAMQSFKRALTCFEQQTFPHKMAEVYFLIGIDFSRKNNLFEAEKHFKKSINIYSNLNDYRGINENYYALSEIFARSGRTPQAFVYLKKYTEFLKKTTFSIDSKAIEELTQSNTREERERLINTQEEELSKELKEKEILQLQSDRQLLGIVIVVVVFFLSGLTLFFVNRQRNTLQEQRETEMSQTLLRSQMNPHFIFNALAVIQSYIYENTPEKTSSFLVNFSRLIRLILENSPKEFITIDIEKEILTKYLTTQKLRFEDRFNFELTIDEDLISKRALIPPMITQPFVENSIEHGQLHTVAEGLIKIIMHERDGMLEIEVTDNGVGREKSAQIKRNTNHKSMAMDITRERIRILNKKYKGKGSLEISDLDSISKTGTRVIICLPLIYENTIFERNEKNPNH